MSHLILLMSFNSLLSFLALLLLVPSLLGCLHISGGKSAITSGGDADFRGERDAGEILDPLLLLHVLCDQLLWKGIF